jgi:hypothetical protein
MIRLCAVLSLSVGAVLIAGWIGSVVWGEIQRAVTRSFYEQNEERRKRQAEHIFNLMRKYNRRPFDQWEEEDRKFVERYREELATYHP